MAANGSIAAVAERNTGTLSPQVIEAGGIINAVSQYYDVPTEALLAKRAYDRGLNDAQAVMFTLMSDYADLSPKDISKITACSEGNLAGKISRVRARADEDPKFQKHVDQLAQAAAGEPLHETVTTWPNLVATHYGLSIEEIAAAKTKRQIEARRVVAHLMVEKTVLRRTEVANRAGFTRPSGVLEAVKQVMDKRREDERFASDLSQLEEGKLPDGLKEDDIIKSAAAYYGVTHEALLGKDTAHRYSRARLMAMHLLIREMGLSYQEAGRLFNRGHGIRMPVLGFERRLESDPNLQRQRTEVLDPETISREPLGVRIVNKVYAFYGVDPAKEDEDVSLSRSARPREAAIYLMAEKFGFSTPEITELLNRGAAAAKSIQYKVKAQVTRDPLLAEELSYLEQIENVDSSINERIVERVAEVNGLDISDVLEGKGSNGTRARQAAMVLMAERGHMTLQDVAGFFGRKSGNSVARVKTIIQYRQLRSPLLVQQLNWVRQNVLTEEASQFVFDESRASELTDSKTGLPAVDEKLADPEVRDKIYALVERVAEFYHLSALEIVGRDRDSMIVKARRAAVLLCAQAGLPSKEVATCFDARSDNAFARLVKVAQAYQEEDQVFTEEIEAIAKGESRPYVLEETLCLVSKFYNVNRSELRSSDGYWVERARTAFLTVMSDHACATRKHLASITGMSPKTAGTKILKTKRQLPQDARLQAEIEYLTNPKETPQPPGADDIVLKVCESFGITEARLLKPQSPDERSAKRLTAYILADELSLPHEEIAEILHDGATNISKQIQLTKQEIDKRPGQILEVDNLRPPHAVSLSITGRVLRFVTGQYQVPLGDLADLDNTKLGDARVLAVNLLVRRAGHTIHQVAEILGIPKTAAQGLVKAKPA